VPFFSRAFRPARPQKDAQGQNAPAPLYSFFINALDRSRSHAQPPPCVFSGRSRPEDLKKNADEAFFIFRLRKHAPFPG
jgi:hypothetical protein